MPYVSPIPPDSNLFSRPSLLNYNEYAVYNEDRVKIRYLLVIKDADRCSLCRNSDSALKLKPFFKQDLDRHKLMDFNNYEAELTKAYLLHTNNSVQTIYNEDMEEFIETGLYSNYQLFSSCVCDYIAPLTLYHFPL